MELTDSVDIVHILNMDDTESKLSSMQIISNSNSTDSDCNYILSDVNEKILILIKFKQIVSLKSITFYANDIDNNNISQHKSISIYKLENLTIDFNDLDLLSPDKSIECNRNKISNGQIIKLQNTSKLQNTQFIAIYIKSNQNSTDKTILNSIILKGESTNNDTVSLDMNIFKIETNNCYHNWSCQACSYSNTSNITECALCYTENSINSKPPTNEWSCDKCTFINPSNVAQCEMCDEIYTKTENNNINFIYECDQLLRILYGIKYYSLLKLDENPSNNDIFISFCQIVYPQLINDYQHIIFHHFDDLEEINAQIIDDHNFGDCNHLKCVSFKRYYNDSEEDRRTILIMMKKQTVSYYFIEKYLIIFIIGCTTYSMLVSEPKKDLVFDHDDNDDMKDSNQYLIYNLNE